MAIDPSTLRGQPGFYRVGRAADGHWWIVRPDGQPMVYKGVCAALRQEVGKAVQIHTMMGQVFNGR
jgi:hypothetical protein